MRSIILASTAVLFLVAGGCQRRATLAECRQAGMLGVGGGPRASDESVEPPPTSPGRFDVNKLGQGTAPAAARYGHSTASDPSGGMAAANGGLTADHPTNAQQ